MATLTLKLNKEYLVPFGIFKLVEFFIILIGWTIFADIYEGGWYTPGRVQFFIGAYIIS